MKYPCMKFWSVLLFCLLTTTVALAQENGYLDSLERGVATAKTEAERISLLEDLSTFYMVIDRAKADAFTRQLQAIAEGSRDRVYG